MSEETIAPQWICMSCKTVVGPVVDDDEHRCNCKDVYLVDLWLFAPVAAATPLCRIFAKGEIMRGNAYSGERVPNFIPVCIYEGWLDFGRAKGNLYRRPFWKKIGWLIGYLCGRTKRAADEGDALAESELSNDELDTDYEVWANQ